MHYDTQQEDYGYRLLNSEPGKFHCGPQWLSGGHPDLHAARVAAFRHLIDATWSHECDDEQRIDELLSECREHGCPLNHTERTQMRLDILERWAWQRRYRALSAEGYDDHACHAIACGNPRENFSKIAQD